jgi:hypothetical protein
MGKIYKSAKGAPVDMEALRNANENAVAVGNMPVNAKGDIIKGGKVVKTAKERITPHYAAKKQVARTSLKPPVREEPKPVIKTEAPTPTAKKVPVAEPVKTVKTRADGSTYEEIFHDDGTVETRELTAPTKKGRKPTV